MFTVRRRRALLLFVLGFVAVGGACGVAGQAVAARLCWTIAALPLAAVVGLDTVHALIGGSLGVDIIALLAIVGALALGETFTAALIALMVAGGNALEEFAEARARRELTAVVSRVPRIAHRANGDAIEDIAAADIQPDDLLLVKPGEIVPVDGVVADASALLDESALTGEPLPLTRSDGDAVRSGVVNAGAPFRLRASATAEASTYAAIVRLVQAAERERPPMERLADRWAIWFLPFTLAVSGLAWWWAGEAERALAVLVVATPCPLILAAPVALISGVSRIARHGIIVKGGGALERLARVRTVLFDKTGTLTTGTPRVSGIEPLPLFDADDLLRLAASLDQVSQHVVAGAIVATARAAGLVLSLPQEVVEISGGGLAGVVNGRRVMLGSAGMLQTSGVQIPTQGAAPRLAAAAASVTWIAVDGEVAGVILLADRIRPETPRAIRELRAAGVRRLVMVSGDRKDSSDAVGDLLALDAVHGELTPAGKTEVVKAERVNGATLMIGDGINDAPALAAADVGIAMGARGAAAAAEAADAVLLVDRIDRVASAITAARRARFIAMQSIAAGMGLSMLAMGIAAAGYLAPVFGALAQEAIDIAVILNALRVLTGNRRPASMPASAELPRVVADHAELRALIERMRRVADRLQTTDGIDTAELRHISDELRSLLLPHQQAEERYVFPELARRLGGRDPLGSMTRMHEEISHLATLFAALVDGMQAEAASIGEAREVRRLLYVLDALIALHLAAEEELLSQVEELPAPLALLR
jgi:heavy metal translocating P-type ATPase